jgi:hypothetical protein
MCGFKVRNSDLEAQLFGGLGSWPCYPSFFIYKVGIKWMVFHRVDRGLSEIIQEKQKVQGLANHKHSVTGGYF